MNVRFFAGKKEQYRNLPTHNPMALYFCEDTNELYWGDRCISDGIRVIPTRDDLPELSKAADGIVYYIKETHNGYIISPDGTEWLQTIYAPAPDAYEVPEDEIFSTVTTVGAVRKIENNLLAKIAELEEKVGNGQNIDLEAYYTKTEVAELIAAAIDGIKIPDVSKFITEIPAEYITESELDSKGYLTEHQSLEGLATEKYVDEAVAGIEIPEVNLDAYSTTTEMNAAIAAAAAIKADVIPFTVDKFVTKPIGNFNLGDNVTGLTVAEIFAKLLGLSDEVITPDQPDIPEEPNGVVANILINKLPMYAVTADEELAEVPYKYMAFTEESGTAIATESGFYQIKDSEGNVIESGYQELQADSDSVYYIIAFPKDVDYDTMISVKAWDALNSCWTGSDKFDMVSDPVEAAELCTESGIDISHIDTTRYTILVWPDLPTGSKLRYVINE